MIVVNLLIKHVTKPVKFMVTDYSGLWELLNIYEKDNSVLQYTLTTATTFITDLPSAFGWGAEFKKLVREFDWSKA